MVFRVLRFSAALIIIFCRAAHEKRHRGTIPSAYSVNILNRLLESPGQYGQPFNCHSLQLSSPAATVLRKFLVNIK